MKHTVAVLRQVTGLGQKELAELVGCSTATIQSIELGRLALSRSLGERIALETGVDLGWLLANNTHKPILDSNGHPYSRETYYNARALAEAGNFLMKDGPLIGEAFVAIPDLLAVVFSMYLEATAQDKFRLFHFRLRQSVRDLEKEMKLDASLLKRDPEDSHAGKDITRLDIQKLVDVFWNGMLVVYGPKLPAARTMRQLADRSRQEQAHVKGKASPPSRKSAPRRSTAQRAK